MKSISLTECVENLKNDGVVIYPTESVFGLGCDPDKKCVVKKLLNLKKRQWNKGLILVASNYSQIQKYISESMISVKNKNFMLNNWPGPITFLVPAKDTVPFWLTGASKFLAVRISSHASIIELCNKFGKAIVSTSANKSGLNPCKTHTEVIEQFGKNIPILYGKLGNQKNPTKIVNIISGELIRHA
ncbi:MAG: Sua5/YciO/YrdC/YwlC family protein [Buchnera aphidicola (Nurudea yanoniella)]